MLCTEFSRLSLVVGALVFVFSLALISFWLQFLCIHIFVDRNAATQAKKKPSSPKKKRNQRNKNIATSEPYEYSFVSFFGIYLLFCVVCIPFSCRHFFSLLGRISLSWLFVPFFFSFLSVRGSDLFSHFKWKCVYLVCIICCNNDNNNTQNSFQAHLNAQTVQHLKCRI